MNVKNVNTVHICAFLILSYVLAQDPIANLPQGRIVGVKVYTENSLTPIEIFFGIPYATAPIGRYRFSAPERHSGWRRTFFAHRMHPRCPQGDVDINNISEDCLFLNIWTPRRADGKTLPVAVILYSETWSRGGTTLPCQELAAEGVVVVTVSYRLHMLSFFTLRSEAARGNLALLDQYLALLWIRDNIAAFGGDPTAITLVGHSAGADSVLHHIASLRARGLFQRAILMSPRDIWKTLNKDLVDANETERISFELARALECKSNIDQEIVHCLRSRSLVDIVSLYSKANWTTGMQPIPDNFLPDTEQYFPTPLPLALSAGKQPMQLDILLGTTDLEAINNSDEDYEDLLKRGASFVSEYSNTKAIPELLQMFSLHRQSEAVPMLTQAVRWEYWGLSARNNVEKDALESVEALARMQSAARWGAGGALLAARLARRVARLYVYRYAEPAGVDMQGRQCNFTGAAHGTDLVALLGDALILQVARRPATQEEKQVSTLFRNYIANFIKFGSPAGDVEWRRYRAGDAHIQDIRAADHRADISHSKEAAFWLQYLPHITNLLTSSEHTEQLTSENGENRMRGGVFALCGVSVVLLLLLLACAVLLHRERAHRSSSADNSRL